MNILFLSQRVPEPPNKGDKIRSHHLMRRLAARHSVHVACLLDEASEERYVQDAARWASGITARRRQGAESALRGAIAGISGRPISVGYFRSGSLAKEVRALVTSRRFDIAVAYCSSMAGYLREFEGPKVIDLVDVDSEKWRQYAERSPYPKKAIYAWEHRLLRAYERQLLERFDRTIVISAAEKETLGRFADAGRVAVVANGVDLESLARRGARAEGPSLVFVGALDYFANADGIAHFAREIFPALRSRVSGATLRVVGRKPGPEVRSLDDLPGVEVVGEVDDIRPELWRAAVAVAPLRIAQGLQNKVLEAMAASVPVVSSPAAVRGIEGRAGEHFRVGDSPEEFANAVAGLLEHPAEADRQAGRARELVARHYSWDRKTEEYEAVLESAAGTVSERVLVGGTL